jgi:hypothetical protein
MFNLTPKDFKDAANNIHKSKWSDEELLQMIRVLQVLTAYFLARKEPIIHFALQMDLNSYENYAHHRGWRCDDGEWKIKTPVVP